MDEESIRNLFETEVAQKFSKPTDASSPNVELPPPNKQKYNSNRGRTGSQIGLLEDNDEEDVTTPRHNNPPTEPAPIPVEMKAVDFEYKQDVTLDIDSLSEKQIQNRSVDFANEPVMRRNSKEGSMLSFNSEGRKKMLGLQQMKSQYNAVGIIQDEAKSEASSLGRLKISKEQSKALSRAKTAYGRTKRFCGRHLLNVRCVYISSVLLSVMTIIGVVWAVNVLSSVLILGEYYETSEEQKLNRISEGLEGKLRPLGVCAQGISYSIQNCAEQCVNNNINPWDEDFMRNFIRQTASSLLIAEGETLWLIRVQTTYDQTCQAQYTENGESLAFQYSNNITASTYTLDLGYDDYPTQIRREQVSRNPGYVNETDTWGATTEITNHPKYATYASDLDGGLNVVGAFVWFGENNHAVSSCWTLSTYVQEWLLEVRSSPNQIIYLVKEDGTLISSTEGDVVDISDDGEVSAVLATDSGLSTISNSAAWLEKHYKSWGSLPSVITIHEAYIDNSWTNHYVSTQKLDDAAGLNVYVVSVESQAEVYADVIIWNICLASGLLVLLALVFVLFGCVGHNLGHRLMLSAIAIEELSQIRTSVLSKETKRLIREERKKNQQDEEDSDLEETVVQQSSGCSQFWSRAAKILGCSCIYEMRLLQRSLSRLRSAIFSFSKYVPPDVVTSLLRNDVVAKQGMSKARISVMFMDIVSFTTICEELDVNELVPLLSQYFDAMGGDIQKNRGCIDKYIGDCIMAMWGAPKPLEEHAYFSVKACLDCALTLHIMGPQWAAKGLPTLKTRFGINTDDVYVGNFGSSSRLAYTCVGDGVNVASRLEGLNKLTGTIIMCSQNTKDDCEPFFLFRYLGRVKVIGRTEPLEIYEPICEREPEDSETKSRRIVYHDKVYTLETLELVCALHGHAVQAYIDGDFDAMMMSIERVREKAGADDTTAQKLYEQAEPYIKKLEPVPVPWEGVFVQREK